MIVNEAELRSMLGLLTSITNEERTVMVLFHPLAESAVKDYIHYDPEQKVTTEHYPRHTHAGGVGLADGTGYWDANASHTRAVFSRTGTLNSLESLQLQRLPLRSITVLRVDSNARFGKGTGAWASGSEWVEGQDYQPEYEQTDLCMSGLLNTGSAWPVEPGSVQVEYRAGYSKDELAGRASVTATDGTTGVITTAGVSAIGLKAAVVSQVQKLFQSWAANKKSAIRGFTPGVVVSEKLGDYSYSIDGSLAGDLAGLQVALAPEAAQHAEPYVNFGWMRL
jgi:hypothetical protein